MCGSSQLVPRTILDISLRLIHSGMSKTAMGEVIRLFQGNPDTMKCHPNVRPPRYLVGTTKMMGIGHNLHQARRLVIVDPEWMVEDQEPAKAHTNRTSQDRITYIYLLKTVGSIIEVTIW